MVADGVEYEFGFWGVCVFGYVSDCFLGGLPRRGTTRTFWVDKIIKDSLLY